MFFTQYCFYFTVANHSWSSFSSI